MRYVIALVIIGAGAFYVLANQGGSTDERPPIGGSAAVRPEFSERAKPEAVPKLLATESRDLSESVVDADRFEQANAAVDQASSADSAGVTFDLGPFIDPDDMSTWPEGQEAIVGEYIDPDEFFADEQPPIEIGEWIDPDVEYGLDVSDPIEIGAYEDPENPTPSLQQPMEIGEILDPDDP